MRFGGLILRLLKFENGGFVKTVVMSNILGGTDDGEFVGK